MNSLFWCWDEKVGFDWYKQSRNLVLGDKTIFHLEAYMVGNGGVGGGNGGLEGGNG